jgi:hypothetical protein
MGKGLIIITLGVSIIIGYFALNLNANSNRGLQTTLDFFETTQARLIANSGIEIYLEKLRRNKNLTGSFLNNTLMDGSFDIHISGVDSLMTISAVGRYRDKIHTSIVTARRTLVTIPDVNSAIYVSSDNIGLDLNGNIDIDGNDHNIDGTPGPQPALPGIAVDDPADSAFIVNSLKPKISNAILGAGGAPSVRTVEDNTDWLTLTESYIFAADTTLVTGTYTTGTVLGTAANPIITYVNGNVDFSGQASGYGVMVVNGNLSMSGLFSYKGIIIAYGQSSIETKTVGNGGIYGAAIFVGQNVNIQATGNSLFYYSSQAILLAQNNLKSSRFEILSWWE